MARGRSTEATGHAVLGCTRAFAGWPDAPIEWMMCHMLELRHLRTLCAIADAGSLGKAAATLGYSQPAISTQLRRLEEMLGGQLFVRSNSGAELTAFGLEGGMKRIGVRTKPSPALRPASSRSAKSADSG